MVRPRANRKYTTPSRRWCEATVLSSDLFGVHDGSYAHSQSHGGDLGQVVAKETSIGHDGVLSQSFHSGPGHEAGPGLVERDVSVGADTCSGTRTGQRLSSGAQVSHRDEEDRLQ